MSKCKAKNPYDCPYHSNSRLRSFRKTIEFFENRIPTAPTFAALEWYEEEIATARARIDAHEKGFRALGKELIQAQKDGDNMKVAELASRISKASAARLKDGTGHDWQEAYSSPFAFGSHVLELAQTSDDVRVPVQLTGTQNWVFLYSRLTREGYEVVDVEGYHDKGGELTKAQRAHILKRFDESKQTIHNNEWDDLYEELFGGNGRSGSSMTLRGLSFKHGERVVRVHRFTQEEQKAHRNVV